MFFLLFKVYWFRLKTIKSGQSQLNQSSWCRITCSQESVFAEMPSQHLEPSTFYSEVSGGREVGYFSVHPIWCHWKENPVAHTCCGRVPVPPEQTRSAGSLSRTHSRSRSLFSTCSTHWTSPAATDLRHAEVPGAPVCQTPSWPWIPWLLNGSVFSLTF